MATWPSIEWSTVNGLSEYVIVDEFVSEVPEMMSCGTTAAKYIGLGHMHTLTYTKNEREWQIL